MTKTALITGSTSGIGLAIARVFAENGYNIVFHGLEADGAEIAREIAVRSKIRHLFFNTDLRHAAAIRNMAAECLEYFGKIDVLVNNAGIQYVSPVENFPEDRWEDLMNIHVSAAFHLTKALFPSMKQNRTGRIINIASAHGLVASPYKSAYIAAKHAIIGFTKAIATEGGAYGVTSNAICPGYVLTSLVEAQIPAQMKAHGMSKQDVIEKIFLKDHLIREFVTPDAIATTALFLAESAAAPFITGTALPVDAGWTAH